MESTAKIHLSAEEAGLIENTEWILTKRRIINKVYQLFGQISEVMKSELTFLDHLPAGIPHDGGKISRGDNYRLLPYIILDYPSRFSKDNIFAVRTMFWWGNFFSVTLHLSGDHKIKFVNNNPDFILFLQKNDFFICVNNDEWQHHFEEKNYLPATQLTRPDFKQVVERPFFKIAKKISLKQWDDATGFILNSFKEILELLQINSQDDKKDLSPGFPITGSDL